MDRSYANRAMLAAMQTLDAPMFMLDLAFGMQRSGAMKPNLRQITKLLERTTPRALAISGGVTVRENQGAAWPLARVSALVRGRATSHQIRVLEVKRSTTILGTNEDLYGLWLEKLPLAVGHFAEVTPIDTRHMHWLVPRGNGRAIEFDSALVDARPYTLVRWRSLDATAFPTEIEARFIVAPADRGTEVTICFRYEDGALQDGLVEKSLRRFKALAETGEIPTIAHTSSARTAEEI